MSKSKKTKPAAPAAKPDAGLWGKVKKPKSPKVVSGLTEGGIITLRELLNIRGQPLRVMVTIPDHVAPVFAAFFMMSKAETIGDFASKIILEWLRSSEVMQEFDDRLSEVMKPYGGLKPD